MKKEPTKEEIIEMAAQLRKPIGEKGLEIGDFMNKGNGPMNLHTLAVVNPKANDRILEIGMGNGNFVSNILSLHPSIHYAGLDYSATMVEEATKNNQKWVDEKRAQFIEASMDKMPFEDGTFNKLFTINTLYFWDDPQKILQEFKRVLKENGTVLISIRPKHIMEKLPVTIHGFKHYDEAAAVNLLKNAGFKNVMVTEIKEPETEIMGQKRVMVTLVLKATT